MIWNAVQSTKIWPFSVNDIDVVVRNFVLLSYCKFSNDTHPVNSKFTIWHYGQPRSQLLPEWAQSTIQLYLVDGNTSFLKRRKTLSSKSRQIFILTIIQKSSLEPIRMFKPSLVQIIFKRWLLSTMDLIFSSRKDENREKIHWCH